MLHSILKCIGNFLIYVAIVGVTVFGLPRFLSWYLETPYPMAAITSGSMWPALKEGDLIFIEGVRREALTVGDVVVYRNRENNTFTIHRVVALHDETLVTKGDANFGEDKPIGYDLVIGRAYEIQDRFIRIPRLGTITVLANKVRP